MVMETSKLVEPHIVIQESYWGYFRSMKKNRVASFDITNLPDITFFNFFPMKPLKPLSMGPGANFGRRNSFFPFRY